MSLVKQSLLVFLLLELLFGAFEYWYKPNIFHIARQLVKPKYLVTSLIVSAAYLVLSAILGYIFS